MTETEIDRKKDRERDADRKGQDARGLEIYGLFNLRYY